MDGSVRFTNVGILEFARPKFSEYFLLESDDEEENNKNFSSSNNVTPSRSSYYSSSSGSSGCTPVSITNELTNVDEDEDTLRVFPDVVKALPVTAKTTSSSDTTTSPTSYGPFLPDGELSTQEAEVDKSGSSKSALNGSGATAAQKQTPVGRPSPVPSPQKQASSLFIGPTIDNNSTTSNAASSSAQNDASSSNSVTINKRKRLLSDRGERELEYPVCDQRTSISSWRGCSFLKGKLCGVGLCNYSNDCFLNSVLQSIVHTAKLARFLVESQDPRHCLSDRVCFSCALRRYILRAVNVSKPFEASWIRQYLPKFFPSHRHGHQEDAHEMLTLLLSALDPPLANKNGASLGSTNKDKFSMVPSSPIEQIFGGNLRNQIKCDVCGTLHTNYEKIREINLGLVRNVRTRVIDLVHDFFRAEQLQCFLCKNCKCKRNATRSTTILRAPSVLIVQLKRFNLFGGKNRSLVLPDLCLNLKKFSFNNEPIEYCLNGVIEHIGTGVNFGHYVSAWRGFDERSWFYFDDSEVYPMSEQKVESMEPYILFYNRVVTTKTGNNMSTPNSGRPYSNGKPQQPNGLQQRSFMSAFSPSNGDRDASTTDNSPQLKRPCLSPSIPTTSHSALPSNNDQVAGKNDGNALINRSFGYRNGSGSGSNGGTFSFKIRKSLPTAMTPRSLLNLNGNQSGGDGSTSTSSTSSNANNSGPKKIELEKKASTNRFFKPFVIR